MYDVQDVSFPNSGEMLAGKLFVPRGEAPHAAIAIMGPVAFVKEQSPLQYASRLANSGIAALIFDPRFHGESTGEPRRLESGEAKISDMRAALDVLCQQPWVKEDRLGLLGICQGVNWAIEAAVQDARVAAIGLVAGHYLTPETAQIYLGDDAKMAARLQRSVDANLAFDGSGEVRYVPITGSQDALLTAPPAHDWYLPWENHAPWFAHRGQWENRIAAMSEGAIWGWRIDETAAKLETPLMMVHGDMAASGPSIPRQIFDTVAATDKTLEWVDGANQLQFYEDPLVIDKVVEPLSRHFRG